MAYGKNKGLAKSGKKGIKKKQMDPFAKKVWYDIKAPAYLLPSDGASSRLGLTVVSKSAGLRSETESLKGRVAEFNVADIRSNSDDGFKKVRVEIQDIQGKACLTEFHGLSLTRDKMCSLVKKKHTLIESVIDCKTSDGYVARVFCMGFTAKAQDKSKTETQVKLFTYAQTSQIRKIRKRITQVLQSEIGSAPMKSMVDKLMTGSFEEKIKKATTRIFPLEPVHIFKVKLVKKPKFDAARLYESHDSKADTGVPVDNAIAEDAGAKNLLDA